jgi:hypothetical protein
MTVKEVAARIQTMTAKEVILSMVSGLRKKHTEINMDTYGKIENGVCYGCAATNCIIEIAEGEKDWYFPNDTRLTISSFIQPIDLVAASVIVHFETAINYLRQGDIGIYNEYEDYINIPTIHVPVDFPELPLLENDYTEEDLLVYEQLANAQPE